jgi:predicted permease
MILDNLSDVRLAWRGLWRARSFSATAILTLALGIAGTTVMFTLVRGVLLRRLPVLEQERLIVAWKELRSSGFAHYPFGDAEIEAVGRASRLLEAVAGVDANGATQEVITEDGVSTYVSSALVTGGFFEVLGVEPVVGRALTRADDVEGAENVLVIGHGLWRRRYAGSPHIVGRRVTVGEQRFTIVGVMPADVDYPTGVEAWRLTRSVPATGPFGDAARREIDLVARLKPGVTIEQATSELTELTKRLESSVPGTGIRGLVPVVHRFEDAVIGNASAAMAALMAAVALVLLIASANAANLLLMRAEGKRADLAVQAALGAGRRRIVRQLLAESLLLTLGAAAAGFTIAWWSLAGLLALIPAGLPRLESVRIDATVVSFTIAVAAFTSMLAGLAPALAVARLDLLSNLRYGARGATGRGARRGRRALVVAQVALAVTVISAAGLLTRSVLKLQSIDVGLTADRLVFVELFLPTARYSERARHAELLDRTVSQLEAVPAIAAATPVSVKPFSGEAGWDVPRFTAEGQGADAAAANPSLNLESIYPNYFATFGITLPRGRAFTDADRDGSLRVAIVSEDVAAATWPDTDPIGKRIKIGGLQSREPWLTIVGVAKSTRYRELAKPRPTLYLPARQFLVTAEMLVLRTTAPLELVASVARDRVRAVDADVRVMRVAPFERMLEKPLGRPRFNAFVLGVFGAVALLLATVGLYGVIAADVGSRAREIALRVALGATAGRVRRVVLGEAAILAGAGVLTGLFGSTIATRALRGMLFEIEPLDPTTLIGAALLLIVATVIASYVPMRRATRIDAVAALRS